jgi:hypoxanthine phosphoribosyltransferase
MTIYIDTMLTFFIDILLGHCPLKPTRISHQIESYFPSLQWKEYLDKLLTTRKRVLIVDDVVNTGFTRLKVESIVHSLARKQKEYAPQQFAALILNKKQLASSRFHTQTIFLHWKSMPPMLNVTGA